MADHADRSGAPTAPAPVMRLELFLIFGITAAGLLLRTWQFGGATLSHFDEGVYAFTGLGLSDPSQPFRLFPDQQKFSPPVYFLLVALANVLGVDPARSPFVVNVVVGSLTIPVVWWLTRRWFGGAPAAAAAVLVAFSEFHILLSRSALTDATFGLTFLVALAALATAIERQTVRSAIVAGLAVGLAWNVKYHGWFALVVGAMVIAGRWRLQRAGNAWLGQAVRVWIVAAAVAVACYLPWAIFIQLQPGSSAGWVSYFATMLRLDWFGNFWRHVQQQQYIEGPWSRASVPLAFLLAQLVGAAQGRRLMPWWVALASGAGALLIGASGVVLILAAWMLARSWRKGMHLPEWILGSVLLLWIVMAPVYHPYFRLLLPFALATYMLAAAALARPVTRFAAGRVGPTVVAAALASVVTWGLGWRIPDPSSPWRPTRFLVQGASELSTHLPAGAPVRALGEPGLGFYLHRDGHPAFGRTSIEALDSATGPVYLVTGVYLRRAPRQKARFEERRHSFELIARVNAGVPSDIRLLDDMRPDAARRWVQHPDTTFDLLLWRYTPSARPPK